MPLGDTASILALSWGKGDPQKDAVTLVFVDEAGRMREHSKIDNLHDIEMVDEFIDLIKRRKPEVVVIGGFSMATLKLSHRVKEVLKSGGVTKTGEPGWVDGPNERSLDLPVIYVNDDVARIYQHSQRAAEEFSTLSPIAKYCVGLARYAQSPLNEFAALGADITAVTFEEDDQHLVSPRVLRSPWSDVFFRYQKKNSCPLSNVSSLTSLTKLGWTSTKLLVLRITNTSFPLCVALVHAKHSFSYRE